MSSLNSARHIWKMLTEGKGFDKILQKVNILSAGDGLCQAEMKVCEEHTNIAGTLHGGMTSTIVDVVSGLALSTLIPPSGELRFNSPSPSGVSVDLHITFLKGVTVGNDILIDAKTIKAGKSLAFLDVLITEKQTGAIVAKGIHTKFVAK